MITKTPLSVFTFQFFAQKKAAFKKKHNPMLRGGSKVEPGKGGPWGGVQVPAHKRKVLGKEFGLKVEYSRKTGRTKNRGGGNCGDKSTIVQGSR